ncbi:MAG TPA: hypothetical protein VFR46_05990 [Actinomycetes bacterium]|nr:hypothetical protein [Actinomycetes bacterium]
MSETVVAGIWVLAIASAGIGWLLNRASESLHDWNDDSDRRWVLLRICAWVLYSLGFLIGTGGLMAAMDIARTPDQYGITP